MLIQETNVQQSKTVNHTQTKTSRVNSDNTRAAYQQQQQHTPQTVIRKKLQQQTPISPTTEKNAVVTKPAQKNRHVLSSSSLHSLDTLKRKHEQFSQRNTSKYEHPQKIVDSYNSINLNHSRILKTSNTTMQLAHQDASPKVG